MSKILGLDVGIGSLGWAVIDEEERRIVDLGVRIFESGEEGAAKAADRASQVRRSYRSTKRLNKRCKQRIKRTKQFLQDNEIISIEDINKAYNTKGFNPDVWRFRSEGLSRRLEPIEIASVLINFANYRGYQDFYEDSEEDSGKLAAAKNRINELYNSKKDTYKTIGQMIYEDPEFRCGGRLIIRNKAIRNKDGKKETDYKYLIDRKDLVDEFKYLLSCQHEFGYEVLTPDAIDELNSIVFKQRDFEDGPGPNKNTDSGRRDAMMRSLKGKQTYSGFDELVGKCPFYPEEKRAHKNSQLYDMYVIVNTLSQLLFYKDGQKIILPETVVMELRQQLFEKNGIITKKELEKICKSYGIELEVPGELSKKRNLLTSPYIKFLSDPEFFTDDLVKEFKLEEYDDPDSFSSRIGFILAKYATPRRRKDEIKSILSEDQYKSIDYADKIKVYKSAGGANVSFKYMREAIQAYFDGVKYGDFQAGFNKEHAEGNKVFLSDNGKVMPITDPDMVRNPVVYRSLNETRKIVNAVRGKYKDITIINIEVAKDVGKSFEQRAEIRKFQNENEANNEKIRQELVQKLTAEGMSVMLSDKLLDRFKLWKSQKQQCVYSGEDISFSELVNGTTVQIDHIIPQSIVLDETLNNKVLVKTEQNQKKGNKLPLQYMDEKQDAGFKNRVNNLYRTLDISRIKKEYLLLEYLDDETIRGFVDRNINDTRTISKYISTYLSKAYNGQVKINVIKGAVTSRFRKRWLGANRWNNNIPSIYGLEEKTRNLHYYHHAIDAVVVANLTRPYIELAQDYVKFAGIRRDIKYHEKHENAATARALFEDLAKEKGKTVDKMNKTYGMNREYVMSLIEYNHVPSICGDLKNEVEVRVPLNIGFDAEGYSEMTKAHKELKQLLAGVKCNLSYDDIKEGRAILPDVLDDINCRIPIVVPSVACLKPNAQIVYVDKELKEDATAEEIEKEFNSFVKKLSLREVKDYISDIDMASEEEYSRRVHEYYEDQTFADSIELPYVSFKINRKFRGSMVASDNPIKLSKTGFDTYKELENDINCNLKSPYYVRFNKGVGEIGNFTIYDARSYYCLEIYIDANNDYQIRGIRYVDIYKDGNTGKMVLKKALPDGCSHYMYLFKNESIKAYKNGKLKNNGFGAYRGVENINQNTGKMRLFSNTNLRGRDTYINLAGECKKIEMSILGHIIGEKKCGDLSLFITEKEST